MAKKRYGSADTQERRATTPRPQPAKNYRPSPGPDIENIRAYGSQRNAVAGQRAADAARKMLPTQYNDPFQGLNPWDLAQSLLTAPVAGSPPGRDRSGGRGGGGGVAGPDPAALQAAYASMLGGFDATPFDVASRNMMAAYSDDPINQTYDRMLGDVNTASAAGQARLGGITNDLNARAGVAQGAVGQSFDQTKAGLDQVRQQALANIQANQGGINDTLSRFGAGQAYAPTADLEALMGGLGGVQTAARGAYNQTFADRGAVNAGLAADVGQGMTQQAQGLQTGIAGQRAAALAAQAQQRAKIQADMELARMQAQQAWQQQQAEIRLQAAQLGIDLGPIPPAPGV